MEASEPAQAEPKALGYERILVPFDGSLLTRAALSLGAWLAWKSGAELNLVQAAPHQQPPSMLTDSSTLLSAEARDEARQ